MTWTGRVTTYHSASWRVTDFIQVEQLKALETYCGRCTMIAHTFNDNTYTTIMYAVTSSYITNYISKLSECFKDLKGVKMWPLSSKNKDSLLAFYNCVTPKLHSHSNSNERKRSTTWARETVSKTQIPLRAEFAHLWFKLYM